MMLELKWSAGSDVAACEHGHLCALIKHLSFDRRFAWMVDTPDHDDPEEVVNLAAGIEVDLASAKRAVLDAKIGLGAAKGGSWIASDEVSPPRRSQSQAQLLTASLEVGAARTNADSECCTLGAPILLKAPHA